MQFRRFKIILFLTFLTFLTVMFLNINTVLAADITVGGITYNENDYTKLKTFLNLNSAVAGKTNGKMINAAYDESNPATWTGVAWTEDAIKRVKSISWSKKSLSGELDISGAEALVLLACDSNSLTALNVSGNTKVTSIRCNTNKLTAIDLSTNIKLDTLYCHTNNLSTLDLSANTSLVYLYCYSNKLTELNVSACTSLNELYCYSNLLTSIDVSTNTLLNKLACESNKLTALDVSRNTALTYLACYSNKLSVLNVSANTNLLALHCYTNEITDLDLSNNIKLTTLYCNNNPLGELDVSLNTKLTALRCDLNKLTELDVSKNTELTFLQCDTNKLTNLDVSKNAALSDLRCYSNQLTELNIQNNIALTKLVCDTNKLTQLDVSKNVLLSSLACYSNQIGLLDLSTNTSLVYLYCQDNQLSQLDVSANTALKELYCYGNQLTALDVSANVELAYLRCYSNQLSELTVDKNIALIQLACQSNQLTELNVSKNKLLTSLDCSSNQLDDLEISSNTALTTIHCQFNNLTGLDVSSNELLTELWCYSNKLTSLNISQNTNLKTVWCYTNKLTELDLSKSKGLDYLKCNDNYLLEIKANVSNKSINVSANGNGYVELSRNSVFQFYVVAVPHAGSVFDSWTQVDTNVSENLSYNLVSGNSYELKANFSQNIVFDSQGGSAIINQIVNYGSLVAQPAQPTKAGYDFKGWYKEAECINAWDFAADTVTQNRILYAKWTTSIPLPTVYTVTFDVDGGSVVPDIIDIVSGSTITQPAQPTKAGYDFKGWYKEAECINAWDFATDTVTQNRILYAKWTISIPLPTVYTVTFDVDGGSVVPDIIDIVSGSTITQPAQPTKAGYDFKGWYKEAECINAWDFAADTVTQNRILYAKWTTSIPLPTVYTVTFDVDGGSVVPDIIDIVSGSTITQPAQPTKAGYDFKGWYKEAECINAWDFAADTVTQNRILYAKWTTSIPLPTVYTVTFDVDGGSVVPDIIDIVSGSTITQPAQPTKAGYDFKGWYKEAECINAWDFAADTVTQNRILYAKWTTKEPVLTCIVMFDSNGGSKVAAIKDIVVGSKITEPAEPTKAGYDFAGWYKNSSLTISWDFETDTVTEDIILYAKWTASTPLPTFYTVTFNVDGGSAVPDIIDIISGSKITQPAQPTKAGYDFKGWYKEAECINAWDFATDTVTQNRILYAKWTISIPLPTVYTVTFDVDGGSVVPDIIDIVSGSTITQPAQPTKAGYDFKGWYKEAECINAWDFATDTVTQNRILYAKWTASTPLPTFYTVTFNVDGGSAVPDIIDIISGSKITQPAQPTKAGYDFKGWYKEAECINAWDFAADTVTQNRILYAKWTAKTPQPTVFIVKFNTIGGSSVSDIINITSGSAITAPGEPTKLGYDFAGWYKEAEYKNAWDFSIDVVIENIILYAKWTAKEPVLTCIVMFDSNGGSKVAAIKDIVVGSKITEPAEPTKAGYDFAGWYKNSSLTISWDFVTDTVTEDIILYAKWTAKEPVLTCIVMFDSNGGSKVAAIKDITVGSKIKEPVEPTKAGYDFTGWYKNSSLTTSWNFETDTVTEDIILYAKWKERSSGTISTPSIIAQNDNNAPIIVNGKTELIAKSVTDIVEGKKSTRIIVDDKKISEKIEQVGMYPKIIIPIGTATEVKIAELNGQTVKNMEGKGAVFEIVTGEITYTLPAVQINIGKVSEEIGTKVELKDIHVIIRISDVSIDVQNLIKATAKKDNYEVITKPVEFSITCSNGDKIVDVSKFNKYVKRTIAIPSNADSGRITTGIVLNNNGSFSHVPTAIDVIDGRYYAKINSLTNSVYSVIWSPKRFNDVEGHWSKAAVNDMGSRLVISGVGKEIFQPDKYITRAEFTEIVVNGLGLMRIGTFKSSFDDVDKAAWYYNSVAIASEYGLILGYNNREFRPNDKITREQAMTIIAKAMKITGLKVQFTIGEVENILKAFGDTEQASYWSKESIAACVKSGIVSGRNGHMIAPDGNMTRAETAVIVRNLLRKSDLI